MKFNQFLKIDFLKRHIVRKKEKKTKKDFYIEKVTLVLSKPLSQLLRIN